MYKALTIAGFDGSGGAGLQADIKTFSALGVYAASVLTALPIQNTRGVRAIFSIPPSVIEEQIEAIVEDIDVDALKIGMLYTKEIIEVVGAMIKKYQIKNVVIDPVGSAKSGDKLILEDAIDAMKEILFPLASIVTPNLHESALFLGKEMPMEDAALEFLKMGMGSIVIKGGHLDASADDCFRSEEELIWLYQERVDTKNTHGTGCTFSAAIAAFLARGLTLLDSVTLAKKYITNALEGGKELKIGKGQGPVHHFYHLWNENLLENLVKTRQSALFPA